MKEAMKRMKKIIIMCLTIVICLCQPAYASAAKKGSITISYPCTNAKISLYYVAYPEKKIGFQMESRFAKYPIKLNNHTKAEWAGQAQALAAYIQRDNLKADSTKITDANRKAQFTNLNQGIYLVVGETKKENGYTYTSMPYFISIPGQSANGEAQYNISSTAKYEKMPVSEEEKTTDYKVAKVWVDKTHEKQRPQSVTIQLLRDGKIYDEVKLNKSNNWQYTWSKLSNKYQWTAVEKEKSDQYFVAVSKQGNSFVVKNIYWNDKPYQDSKKPEKKKPGKKNIKTKENYYQDTKKPNNSKTDENSTTKANTQKLPQTGQLWWPLPFLLAGGIVCVGIGMFKQKRENDEKE